MLYPKVVSRRVVTHRPVLVTSVHAIDRKGRQRSQQGEAVAPEV